MAREHKHLILKGYLHRPPISSIEIDDAFLDIVELINMKVLHGPKTEYCHEEGNEGFTGVILLTTSHMIWHDWETDDPEDTGAELQFDLYSCKDYDVNKVLSYLKEEFDLSNYEYKVFDRTYALIEEKSSSV